MNNQFPVWMSKKVEDLTDDEFNEYGLYVKKIVPQMYDAYFNKIQKFLISAKTMKYKRKEISVNDLRIKKNDIYLSLNMSFVKKEQVKSFSIFKNTKLQEKIIKKNFDNVKTSELSIGLDDRFLLLKPFSRETRVNSAFQTIAFLRLVTNAPRIPFKETIRLNIDLKKNTFSTYISKKANDIKEYNIDDLILQDILKSTLLLHIFTGNDPEDYYMKHI